jgi:hypothetical protein
VLCTVWDHRGADVSPSWLTGAAPSRILPPNGRILPTLQDAADYMMKLPEDVRDPPQNQNTPRWGVPWKERYFILVFKGLLES